MTAAQARFHEAASFFAIFARSPWKACHVRTGDMEIFVARDRETSNPMTGDVSDGVVEAGSTLRASHLGTLTALADVGTTLAPGQVYARLELLGEVIELHADRAGTVASQLLPVGGLVEYDQPLLSWREA